MKTNFSFLVTFLFLAYQVNAKVITVDNSVGANAQYSDLQSAISTANSGDVIYVHASENSYGTVTVAKTLSLIGFSHSNPEKATFIEAIILEDGSSNSRFSGLYITESISTDTNNTTTLTGLIIENSRIGGVYFAEAGSDNSLSGADDVLIRGNIINYIGGTSATNYSYTNTIISNNIIRIRIYVENYQSVVIKNNLFYTPSSGGRVPVINNNSSSGSIIVQNSIMYNAGYNMNNAGVIFENCLQFDYSGNRVPPILNGTNNVENEDPLFVYLDDDYYAYTDDNYNLQSGSPAIGKGAGGVDIGLYDDSAFTFNNFGYTNSIPTVKITSITDRIAPGANLSVSISTNAN